MDRQPMLLTCGSPKKVFGRASLAAVLLVCFVLTPPVHAQEQGELQDYIRSARGLYDDLEYERALAQLALAKRFSRGAEDDALLSLYEAVILADLGKQEESTAAFKAALLIQPDAELPVQVSPKVEQWYETLRRQVKQDLARDALNSEAREPPSRDTPVPEHLQEQTPVEAKPIPPAVVAPQELNVSPVAAVSKSSEMRGRAWMPATLGGVLLVGGGVSYALARRERSRLRDDASLTTLQDVDRSVSRGRTYQAVGLGLAGAGVVALGISAGMYLLGGVSESEKTALSMSTDGTSAFLFGRWP